MHFYLHFESQDQLERELEVGSHVRNCKRKDFEDCGLSCCRVSSVYQGGGNSMIISHDKPQISAKLMISEALHTP